MTRGSYCRGVLVPMRLALGNFVTSKWRVYGCRQKSPMMHCLSRLCLCTDINRTMTALRPKFTRNFDFDIEHHFLPEHFLIADLCAPGYHHLVFGTECQQRLLTQIGAQNIILEHMAWLWQINIFAHHLWSIVIFSLVSLAIYMHMYIYVYRPISLVLDSFPPDHIHDFLERFI